MKKDRTEIIKNKRMSSITYREFKIGMSGMLRDACIENAEEECLIILREVCGMSSTEYLLNQNNEMPAAFQKKCLRMAEKRSRRIPLQLLTRRQDFMGLPFHVCEGVLIPRQDTEILVEEALKIIRPGDRVLDLCTGSGCIAISIKCLCPEAHVAASDLYERALRLAAENAAENNADIEIVKSNLLQNISGPLDVLVSNPPYIPTEMINSLMPEVRDFEPREALDGGADGLDLYRAIVPQAAKIIVPGGHLLFETGSDQAGDVADLMRKNGFCEVSVIRDLAGLDRVVKGRKENV